MTPGRLHVITDFFFQQRYTHAELAEMACGAGADTIQFRQKHGGVRDWLSAARDTKKACDRARVPLIIDDSIPIALSVRASGVHLGQNDFPIDEARRVLGSDFIIGASATTLAQALKAEEDGATYIGFGPVFNTRSKANLSTVKGLEGLSAVCKRVEIPVIAIGGINSDNVSKVLEAGAFGVAVMSAITTSGDPFLATSRVRQRIDQHVRKHSLA